MQKTNETIKLENLRKDAYRRIWDLPLSVKPGDIAPRAAECRPKNMAAAQNRVITELGAYAAPDVALDAGGETVYAFKELEREKEALIKYRAGINPEASTLGKTVFDSEA
jgi:hypothetical protein